MRVDLIVTHFRYHQTGEKSSKRMSYTQKSIFATLPRTTRGMPIVVGGDPKGKNFLYTNGNSVIIRELENPGVSDIYTQHAVNTTAAKYSPSGFYIASGDVSGKIRIWDTTQKEHILKNEFQPLGGAVKDMAWSSDNQRIVVGGEGRDKFGHVFNAETGTSVGVIMGHSKGINSVDFKPSRPFRVVTASEDNSTAFFEGPPFTYKANQHDHTRFVNAVRYSPNGEKFVTGSADGKAFVYDGKTAEKVGELGSPAHTGGIYAVSFNGDGSKVMTASGDKSVKVFDVESGAMDQQFVLGKNVEDMQVSCLWQGNTMISVSLSGFINYLDPENPSSPKRIIKGHNKPITSIALSEDRQTIFTSGSDGLICYWDANTSENDQMQGKGHVAQVQNMAICDGQLITCSIDDTVRFSNATSKEYGTAQVKLDSQPKKLAAASDGLVIVACINDIAVIRGHAKVFSLKVNYEPNCVAIHPGLHEVAVGGNGDNTLHIYSLVGDTLQEKRHKKHTGPVMDVKYSPDGAHLAACDGARRVVVYSTTEIDTEQEFCQHQAKVLCVAWSPNSEHVVSGSLDTHVVVYTLAKPLDSIKIKNAHQQNPINGVAWIDDNTVVSVGQDSNIKQWTINY